MGDIKRERKNNGVISFRLEWSLRIGEERGLTEVKDCEKHRRKQYSVS